MWAISLKNSFKVLILLFLINNYSFALGDRHPNGNVEIDVRGNNICFSVNRFKFGNFFFGSEKVDNNEVKFSLIEVTGDNPKFMWSMSKIPNNPESSIILNSKRCVVYGENLSGYATKKGPMPLKTAKGYRVSMWVFNTEGRPIIFASKFDLEVTGETIKVTKIY